MPQITQLHLIKLYHLFVASISFMQPNGFVTKAAGNLFNCSIVFFKLLKQWMEYCNFLEKAQRIY